MHVHAEAVTEHEPAAAAAGALEGAAAVDVGVPRRVGQEVEDRFGRCRHDPLHGDDVTHGGDRNSRVSG